MRVDAQGKDNGGVSIEIASPAVTVGHRYWMKVIYTAGPAGVAVGGSLRFKLPGLILRPGQAGPVGCSNPQVKLECANIAPVVDGKRGKEFFTIDYLFVTVRESPLAEGDTVTVCYGQDIALAGAAAPRMAQRWAVEVASDLDGARSAPGSGFYLAADPPVIEFVNDRPARIEITVPSNTVAGRPFRTTVRLRDRYQNLVSDYQGTVALVEAGGAGGVIQTHAFTAADAGVHAFENVRLEEVGINRLLAVEEALGFQARSNPTRTAATAPAQAVFWGDTHCHTSFSADEAAYSDLDKSPAQAYAYARDRAALDFCMVTDHVEDQDAQEWQETREAARSCYEPGRFVTFSGFEATFGPSRRNGDKNVYFFGDDEEWIQSGTTEQMYENLLRRGGKVMVIPHLHEPTNWALHEPALERVVEIYAHWGCGLSAESTPPLIPGLPRPAESYVTCALERGARLGFIASADHSWAHPGDDFWWPLSDHQGGLAAVYAAQLTREGIWEGLWDRCCYATTRARILLEFSIDGHMMGREITQPAGGAAPREIRVNAYGTAGIETIEIIKNGRPWKLIEGRSRLDVELACEDAAVERQTDYYYVHVMQADGEQAWSSPIWVRVQ